MGQRHHVHQMLERPKAQGGVRDANANQKLSITDISSDNIAIKLFSDSFLASGRLDAEHYQPNFDELERMLQATGRAEQLGNLLDFNQRGSQPVHVEDGGTVVLNSKHIRENRIEFSDNRMGDQKSTGLDTIIRKGDVLINGTGVGTIGRAAAYLKEENALPDNHVTILRTKDVDPLFLALQLNSLLGKLQVEKFQKGSSGQIELYPTDINQFTIWRASDNMQSRIKDYLEEAYKLEQQSKQLVSIAKLGIERARISGEYEKKEYRFSGHHT